jgi:hypothetical protein
MVAIAGRVDSQDEVCPSHNGEKPARRMSAGSNPRKQGGEVQPLAFTVWTPSSALARFEHPTA